MTRLIQKLLTAVFSSRNKNECQICKAALAIGGYH